MTYIEKNFTVEVYNVGTYVSDEWEWYLFIDFQGPNKSVYCDEGKANSRRAAIRAGKRSARLWQKGKLDKDKARRKTQLDKRNDHQTIIFKL